MLELTNLPKEFISGTVDSTPHRFGGPSVGKCTIEGVDEMQYLFVAPRTSINLHGHDNQWEVTVCIDRKRAYICLIGEEHELINNSDGAMILMTIKGHIAYSYDDLAAIFYAWGFSVTHGSLVFEG